jgi:hypothetical protein
VESMVHLPRAEEANRQRFEAETFRGLASNKAVADAIRGLKDGASATFKDAWQRSYNLTDGTLPKRIEDVRELGRSADAYGALGRTGVLSSGEFKAHRRGDSIRILGDVTHELNSRPWQDRHTPPKQPADDFDFQDGQPGSVPARALEAAGGAKPYPMRYTRQQRVDAEVRIGRNGELTLDRATWSPIEQ